MYDVTNIAISIQAAKLAILQLNTLPGKTPGVARDRMREGRRTSRSIRGNRHQLGLQVFEPEASGNRGRKKAKGRERRRCHEEDLCPRLSANVFRAVLDFTYEIVDPEASFGQRLFRVGPRYPFIGRLRGSAPQPLLC